jgi:hypothetical protein
MEAGAGCRGGADGRGTGMKFMLTGGTPAAAGGPRQSAETGIARAETLGPDGGPRTWKPGPGGTEGPTDAKEPAHNLFPLGMLTPGKGAGARGGGPRGMGEEVGRSGARARHATQPAPGTAAGGRASPREFHRRKKPRTRQAGHAKAQPGARRRT